MIATTLRRRLLQGVVGLVVVGGVAWGLSIRIPFGPAAGSLHVADKAPTVDATEPAVLRIGTYNIHGGRGTDGLRDFDRTAQVLRGLDFVGLNEVHGDTPWNDENQAQTLGRMLHLTPLYAPTEQRWRCLEFGNGLLTRINLDDYRVVPLQRKYGRSYRNLIHALARAPNGVAVSIIVTHLDRSDDRERREQLKTVGEMFLALPTPAVLMGDLNSDAEEPALQDLLAAPGVVDALGSILGAATPRHIDWILVRGATVTAAGIGEPGPSDHPHVWAEISVAPANIPKKP